MRYAVKHGVCESICVLVSFLQIALTDFFLNEAFSNLGPEVGRHNGNYWYLSKVVANLSGADVHNPLARTFPIVTSCNLRQVRFSLHPHILLFISLPYIVWRWGSWNKPRRCVRSSEQHCAPEVLSLPLVLALCHHHHHPPAPAVQVNNKLWSFSQNYLSFTALSCASFATWFCVHQDLPIDHPCLPKTSDKNLVDTWVFVSCTAAISVCFPSKAKIEKIHQLRSVPSLSSSEKRPEQGGWQNRGGDRLPRLGRPFPHPLQPHNSPLSRLPQRSCLPAQARARNKIMLQFYSIRIWSFHNKENVLTPLIKETPN